MGTWRTGYLFDGGVPVRGSVPDQGYSAVSLLVSCDSFLWLCTISFINLTIFYVDLHIPMLIPKNNQGGILCGNLVCPTLEWDYLPSKLELEGLLI